MLRLILSVFAITIRTSTSRHIIVLTSIINIRIDCFQGILRRTILTEIGHETGDELFLLCTMNFAYVMYAVSSNRERV